MLRSPPPVAFNASSLSVTSFSEALLSTLMDIRVTTGSKIGWLQAFSATTAPQNGTIPIIPAISLGSALTDYAVSFQPAGLPIQEPGLTLAFSSTRESFTAIASGELSITALVEDWESFPLNTNGDSTAGDTTTLRNYLTVWAESAGPNRLNRLQIQNTTGSTMYVVIYAEDLPDSGSRIVSWAPIPANSKVELTFGSGIFPFQKDADGTMHQGCTINAQPNLTPGNATPTNDFRMKAYYAA